MAKKGFWLGMFGMALTLGFMALGSESTPAMEQAPVGAAVLGGKTAVILPVTLAERVKAKDSDTSITGITRLLAVSLAVDDYAKLVDEVAARNNDAITAKIEAAYAAFIGAYNAAFNSTPSKVSFDFGKKAPPFNYFAKPGKDVVAQVTQICAANNADYVVAILYQFADGPVVTVFTEADTTRINVGIAVLDKTGTVISAKYAGTEDTEFVFGKIKTTQEEADAAYDVLMMELFDAFQNGLPALAAVL
jgi:hypothetical protein